MNNVRGLRLEVHLCLLSTWRCGNLFQKEPCLIPECLLLYLIVQMNWVPDDPGYSSHCGYSVFLLFFFGESLVMELICNGTRVTLSLQLTSHYESFYDVMNTVWQNYLEDVCSRLHAEFFPFSFLYKCASTHYRSEHVAPDLLFVMNSCSTSGIWLGRSTELQNKTNSVIIWSLVLLIIV